VSKDLVLEIGTEEIPAGYIPPALGQLAEGTARVLDRERLAHGPVRTGGTPRRLVVLVPDLAEKQEDVSVEVVGPPKDKSYDSDGRPTKAALGFAKTHGVPVESLRVKVQPKGEYLSVVVERRGRSAAEILAERLPELVLGLEFPKSMRWRSGPVRFARPIRWILALLGGDVLPLEIAGLTAGRTTRGHRFLSEGVLEVPRAPGSSSIPGSAGPGSARRSSAWPESAAGASMRTKSCWMKSSTSRSSPRRSAGPSPPPSSTSRRKS
jgi:glycyl-tRNA synthetase beta chain